MFASAMSPLTVVLPASLLQELCQASQAFVVALFPLGDPKALQPDLLRSVRLDAALVLIKLALVLLIVALDDRDLFVSQARNPADDLVVGAPALKIRDQIMNRDPVPRKLKSSATIEQSDLVLHTIPPPG
jgi:hypothetical protein